MSPSALLVLDLQPAMLPLPDDYLARVTQAITHARATGVPVLYVVVGFRTGAPEMPPRHRDWLSSLDPSAFMQIAPAVAPQPGELLVVKRRVSAFTGSDLEQVLRSAGIRHLLLAGVATSGAVLSTVCEASDRDYELTVLADACLDSDEEVHRVLVNKVFPRRGQVLTVADWAGLAG
ncbi:MAG: cysteine hydrolase [Hymenobacter sp.]|nr:MAG: cysteine hydrolase [Hymenobacter sp.]